MITMKWCDFTIGYFSNLLLKYIKKIISLQLLFENFFRINICDENWFLYVTFDKKVRPFYPNLRVIRLSASISTIAVFAGLILWDYNSPSDPLFPLIVAFFIPIECIYILDGCLLVLLNTEKSPATFTEYCYDEDAKCSWVWDWNTIDKEVAD